MDLNAYLNRWVTLAWLYDIAAYFAYMVGIYFAVKLAIKDAMDETGALRVRNRAAERGTPGIPDMRAD